MSSGFERLKAVAGGASAPSRPLERRILAATGLHVVWRAPREAAYISVRAGVMELLRKQDRAGLRAAFDRHFAAPRFTASGYRTYRVMQEALAEAAEMDEYAQLFGAWSVADPADPLVAAVTAMAELARADVAVRVAGASNRPTAAADLVRAARNVGRELLGASVRRGLSHWLWRRADFQVASAGGVAGGTDDTAARAAFAAVRDMDPLEFGIWDERAGRLARSGATAASCLGALAASATERTAATFGDLLYARIFDRGLDHVEAPELGVDPARMLRAFGDWYERYPGQPLANRYAAYAHAFGDEALLRDLFRDTLREIHPCHWFSPTQPLDAWRSIADK